MATSRTTSRNVMKDVLIKDCLHNFFDSAYFTISVTPTPLKNMAETNTKVQKHPTSMALADGGKARDTAIRTIIKNESVCSLPGLP